MSEFRAAKNRQALARLQRALPANFPAPVLTHALARAWTPPMPRLAVDSYWRHHPVRADRLARALPLGRAGFRMLLPLFPAAIESFRRAPARFDAVITDERMPVLHGTTLAGMIHELRADIPILLVTGHRERQTDVRALRAGIIEILDKPLRAGALRAALGRAFAAAH